MSTGWSYSRRSSGWSSAWGSRWSTIRGFSAAGRDDIAAELHVVVDVHISPSGYGSRRGWAEGCAGAAFPISVGRWKTLSTRTQRGVVPSSATGSGHSHLAAPELVARPAASSIPIAAGDEGVRVVGVPLTRSPWLFRGLSLALAAGTGGGAAEAVPRTPWPGYGIQPVSGPLTPCTACSVP